MLLIRIRNISENQQTDTVESDNDNDNEFRKFTSFSQKIFQYPSRPCFRQFFQQHPVQPSNSSQMLLDVKLYSRQTSDGEDVPRQWLSFSKKMNLCTVHIAWHLSILILLILQGLQMALQITVVSARDLWSKSPPLPTVDTFKITFAL